MLYSSFTSSCYLISMRGEANGLVAARQRMSFVEGSALLGGEAVSMYNWVSKFRSNIMFPSIKVGMSWQLQCHFAGKRILRCAAANF